MKTQYISGKKEVAEIIGDVAADKLLAMFAGAKIYVPSIDRVSGSKLSGVIGVTGAKSLAEQYGGTWMVFSCANVRGTPGRKARSIAMLKAGHSLTEVARDLDLTLRAVSNHAKEIRDDRQLQLPFDKS